MDKNIPHIEVEKIPKSNDEFELMFEHKGKIAKLIPSEYIKNYKHLLFFLKDLQNKGKLSVHPENNYLGENNMPGWGDLLGGIANAFGSKESRRRNAIDKLEREKETLLSQPATDKYVARMGVIDGRLRQLHKEAQDN